MASLLVMGGSNFRGNFSMYQLQPRRFVSDTSIGLSHTVDTSLVFSRTHAPVIPDTAVFTTHPDRSCASRMSTSLVTRQACSHAVLGGFTYPDQKNVFTGSYNQSEKEQEDFNPTTWTYRNCDDLHHDPSRYDHGRPSLRRVDYRYCQEALTKMSDCRQAKWDHRHSHSKSSRPQTCHRIQSRRTVAEEASNSMYNPQSICQREQWLAQPLSTPTSLVPTSSEKIPLQVSKSTIVSEQSTPKVHDMPQRSKHSVVLNSVGVRQHEGCSRRSAEERGHTSSSNGPEVLPDCPVRGVNGQWRVYSPDAGKLTREGERELHATCIPDDWRQTAVLSQQHLPIQCKDRDSRQRGVSTGDELPHGTEAEYTDRSHRPSLGYQDSTSSFHREDTDDLDDRPHSPNDVFSPRKSYMIDSLNSTCHVQITDEDGQRQAFAASSGVSVDNPEEEDWSVETLSNSSASTSFSPSVFKTSCSPSVCTSSSLDQQLLPCAPTRRHVNGLEENSPSTSYPCRIPVRTNRSSQLKSGASARHLNSQANAHNIPASSRSCHQSGMKTVARRGSLLSPCLVVCGSARDVVTGRRDKKASAGVVRPEAEASSIASSLSSSTTLPSTSIADVPGVGISITAQSSSSSSITWNSEDPEKMKTGRRSVQTHSRHRRSLPAVTMKWANSRASVTSGSEVLTDNEFVPLQTRTAVAAAKAQSGLLRKAKHVRQQSTSELTLEQAKSILLGNSGRLGVQQGSQERRASVFIQRQTDMSRPEPSSAVAVASESAQGDISSESAQGDMSSGSAQGDISSESAQGDISSESAQGDISSESAQSDISSESAQGDISSESAQGDISSESAQGDISSGSAQGDISSESAQGDISSESAQGDISSESAQGDISSSHPSSPVLAATNLTQRTPAGFLTSERENGQIARQLQQDNLQAVPQLQYDWCYYQPDNDKPPNCNSRFAGNIDCTVFYSPGSSVSPKTLVSQSSESYLAACESNESNVSPLVSQSPGSHEISISHSVESNTSTVSQSPRSQTDTGLGSDTDTDSEVLLYSPSDHARELSAQRAAGGSQQWLSNGLHHGSQQSSLPHASGAGQDLSHTCQRVVGDLKVAAQRAKDFHSQMSRSSDGRSETHAQIMNIFLEAVHEVHLTLASLAVQSSHGVESDSVYNPSPCPLQASEGQQE